jgi:recombinational DNA repair protein (RecF pathway)
MTAAVYCARCGREVARKATVPTKLGAFCKHCAATLPTHLRRPPKPRRKVKT